MSLVFRNIDPPSPSPPGECVLPPPFVHTRRAGREVGGQYFGRRETQDCPLTVIISLRARPTLPYIVHTGAGLPVDLATCSISNRVYVLKQKHYFCFANIIIFIFLLKKLRKPQINRCIKFPLRMRSSLVADEI
jgi:hypothetical protein